jgi:hypothetical protein
MLLVLKLHGIAHRMHEAAPDDSAGRFAQLPFAAESPKGFRNAARSWMSLSTSSTVWSDPITTSAQAGVAHHR